LEARRDKGTEKNNQLQAHPSYPASVQGSYPGRTQGETAKQGREPETAKTKKKGMLISQHPSPKARTIPTGSEFWSEERDRHTSTGFDYKSR